MAEQSSGEPPADGRGGGADDDQGQRPPEDGSIAVGRPDPREWICQQWAELGRDPVA